MTLTQLEYLVALDTHRHFGEAAESCGVSQPTLSMGIGKLEEELGGRLFDRSRKPIVATDLGRRVVEQARTALAEVNRISMLSHGGSVSMSGRLEIGVVPTLAPYLVPLVASAFRDAYPDISLVFHQLSSSEIVARVLRDSLHAALVATDESQSGILTRPLFREQLYAYLSPDHSLSTSAELRPSQIDGMRAWLPPDLDGLRGAILEQLACSFDESENGFDVQGAGLETLCNVVESGAGMTFVPAFAAAYMSGPERRLLRPVTEPPFRTISLISGRRDIKRAEVGALGDCLLGRVRQLVESQEGIEILEGPLDDPSF